MTVTYKSANETDTIITKIEDGVEQMLLVGVDGPMQQEYQAWLDAGNTLEPYIPPAPSVPQMISDRQFFQQAAVAQIITQAEALAAVQTGTIPSMLQMIVDGIADPDQKFAATMLLAGATVFERNHPLTEAVGAALGWTSGQIDQFFISAAQL